MKYTYYSSIKSGKRMMRDLFCLNNRSAVCMSPSKPIWASCLEPFGNILKWEWYYCNESYILQKRTHYIDKNKILEEKYCEMWFPVKNSQGRKLLDYKKWKTHENFWGCLDDILRRDIITNPFSLFGYAGRDSHKFMLEMSNDNPPLKPHPDIIQQLRKRKSIVAYKENIEHLAYNVFSCNGRPESVEQTIYIINEIRNFQKYIPKFLEKYDIPYEMFSLDSGDYAKTFDLDKVIPRNSTDNFWKNNLGQDVKKLVSDYMRNYP